MKFRISGFNSGILRRVESGVRNSLYASEEYESEKREVRIHHAEITKKGIPGIPGKHLHVSGIALHYDSLNISKAVKFTVAFPPSKRVSHAGKKTCDINVLSLEECDVPRDRFECAFDEIFMGEPKALS